MEYIDNSVEFFESIFSILDSYILSTEYQSELGRNLLLNTEKIYYYFPFDDKLREKYNNLIYGISFKGNYSKNTLEKLAYVHCDLKFLMDCNIWYFENFKILKSMMLFLIVESNNYNLSTVYISTDLNVMWNIVVKDMTIFCLDNGQLNSMCLLEKGITYLSLFTVTTNIQDSKIIYYNLCLIEDNIFEQSGGNRCYILQYSGVDDKYLKYNLFTADNVCLWTDEFIYVFKLLVPKLKKLKSKIVLDSNLSSFVIDKFIDFFKENEISYYTK